MTGFFSVEIKDRSALAALERARLAGVRPAPMLREIGEDLMASTKERFLSSKGPDGVTWAANSQTTISRYLSGRSGMRTKSGDLSARANSLTAGKKPLIGRSKMLSHTIAYRVHQALLLVGSPMEYAATHQFGAEKGSFGADRRGHPIPWGDIPARPFLGLSPADSILIVRIAEKHLRNF